MRAAYVNAAVPDTATILGKPLLPFSLGHQILLERFDSAYSIFSTEPKTFADLILSVFICSQTYERALAALASPWRTLRFRLWGIRCGKKWNPLTTARSFESYIASGTQTPNFAATESGGSQPGSPFPQWVKVNLMAHLGLSETEALNKPYSLAVWDYLTYWESQGKGQIVTDDFDRDVEAAVAAHHRIMAKLQKN